MTLELKVTQITRSYKENDLKSQITDIHILGNFLALFFRISVQSAFSKCTLRMNKMIATHISMHLHV